MSVTAPATTAIRPRPVFCPIAHLHRSRARADDVLAGRYTELGRTLALGPDPDWVADGLAGDEEWRLSFVKLYVGLDLAHAFAETGDARYLRAWERLVLGFLAGVPVGHDSADVTARRVQNWAYAWSMFAHAPGYPGLSEGADRRVAEGIAEGLAFVRANLTHERNHRTLELYALFVVPLALPEADADGALRRFATAELARNLEQEFRADGVHREHSTHYHLVALRSFAAACENARRAGVELPARFDAALARACDFALHVTRPDGRIPALSDADSEAYPELLGLAARLLDRPDLAYAASGGRRGTPPAQRNVSFPAAGYHVQRSGWTGGAAERFLVLDCGPLGDGGHGHYDALSFEAFAGVPLVVDPGRYTYSEEGPENLRRWFKGTAAHNTVCVDGLDQTPYRRGKPRGPVAEARLLERLEGASLDVLHGEVRSPCYPAVHRRRVVFAGGDLWIVEDRLESPEAHRYDLRFQLAPEAGRPSLAAADGVTTVLTRRLALALAPGLPVRLEPGFVSPLYGIRRPAPVVAAARRAERATFVSALVPLASGEGAPAVLVAGAGSGRAHVHVRRADGRTDAVVLDDRGGATAVEWTRTDALGRPAGHERVASEAAR